MLFQRTVSTHRAPESEESHGCMASEVVMVSLYFGHTVKVRRAQVCDNELRS